MKRNPYIDFLRSLGLLLLIGVHVNAPNWYINFRCFDVSLMVFVSGLCYHSSGKGNNISSYKKYVLKRFKRLYYPVFIFLSIFFILWFIIFQYIFSINFSIYDIIGSYLLLNYPSIGYVWIIRIFIMISLVIPFLHIITKKFNFILFLSFVLFLLSFQSIFILLLDYIKNFYFRYFLTETLTYTLGYSIIAMFGLNIKKLNFKQQLITILIFLLITVLIIYNNCGFAPQKFKYPPHSLYLSYGVLICLILWIMGSYLKNIVETKIFYYLSKNSLWLYLWHILPVYIINFIYDFNNFWFGRYIIVLVMTFIINYFFKIIIKKITSLKKLLK